MDHVKSETWNFAYPAHDGINLKKSRPGKANREGNATKNSPKSARNLQKNDQGGFQNAPKNPGFSTKTTKIRRKIKNFQTK